MSAPTESAPGSRTVKVWDPVVRLFHWTVATSIVLNLFVLDSGKYWHRTTGYAVAIAFGVRFLWGFVGTRHARWSDFWPWPSQVIAYLRLLWSGQNPRFVGHNPLGSLAILAFFVLVALLTGTGWLLRTDAFFGSPEMEEIHGVIGDALMWLMFLHVAGVTIESLRHRENLVVAMITGRKRAYK
ncbi:MAG TPA: cytochrome b/b6 domain-containing protein [Geminicoccus sp.]|nr:cytochrome b/b6 domain-containing protein [Geminicoccus sp.]